MENAIEFIFFTNLQYFVECYFKPLYSIIPFQWAFSAKYIFFFKFKSTLKIKKIGISSINISNSYRL